MNAGAQDALTKDQIERIKVIVKENALTAANMMSVTGFHYKTVQRWIRGETTNITNLRSFFEKLGVNIPWGLTGNGEKYNSQNKTQKLSDRTMKFEPRDEVLKRDVRNVILGVETGGAGGKPYPETDEGKAALLQILSALHSDDESEQIESAIWNMEQVFVAKIRGLVASVNQALEIQKQKKGKLK